jgi:hypothetical protein
MNFVIQYLKKLVFYFFAVSLLLLELSLNFNFMPISAQQPSYTDELLQISQNGVSRMERESTYKGCHIATELNNKLQQQFNLDQIIQVDYQFYRTKFLEFYNEDIVDQGVQGQVTCGRLRIDQVRTKIESILQEQPPAVTLIENQSCYSRAICRSDLVCYQFPRDPLAITSCLDTGGTCTENNQCCSGVCNIQARVCKVKKLCVVPINRDARCEIGGIPCIQGLNCTKLNQQNILDLPGVEWFLQVGGGKVSSKNNQLIVERSNCKDNGITCTNNLECCSRKCNYPPCELNPTSESCTVLKNSSAPMYCVASTTTTSSSNATCEKNLKPCQQDSQCCSKHCSNQRNICVDNFKCTDCVPIGRKVSGSQICCPNLLKNSLQYCVPDSPPPGAFFQPSQDFNKIKKNTKYNFFSKFYNLIFSPLYAQENQTTGRDFIEGNPDNENNPIKEYLDRCVNNSIEIYTQIDVFMNAFALLGSGTEVNDQNFYSASNPSEPTNTGIPNNTGGSCQSLVANLMRNNSTRPSTLPNEWQFNKKHRDISKKIISLQNQYKQKVKEADEEWQSKCVSSIKSQSQNTDAAGIIYRKLMREFLESASNLKNELYQNYQAHLTNDFKIFYEHTSKEVYNHVNRVFSCVQGSEECRHWMQIFLQDYVSQIMPPLLATVLVSALIAVTTAGAGLIVSGTLLASSLALTSIAIVDLVNGSQEALIGQDKPENFCQKTERTWELKIWFITIPIGKCRTQVCATPHYAPNPICHKSTPVFACMNKLYQLNFRNQIPFFIDPLIPENMKMGENSSVDNNSVDGFMPLSRNSTPEAFSSYVDYYEAFLLSGMNKNRFLNLHGSTLNVSSSTSDNDLARKLVDVNPLIFLNSSNTFVDFIEIEGNAPEKISSLENQFINSTKNYIIKKELFKKQSEDFKKQFARYAFNMHFIFRSLSWIPQYPPVYFSTYYQFGYEMLLAINVNTLKSIKDLVDMMLEEEKAVTENFKRFMGTSIKVSPARRAPRKLSGPGQGTSFTMEAGSTQQDDSTAIIAPGASVPLGNLAAGDSDSLVNSNATSEAFKKRQPYKVDPSWGSGLTENDIENLRNSEKNNFKNWMEQVGKTPRGEELLNARKSLRSAMSGSGFFPEYEGTDIFDLEANLQGEGIVNKNAQKNSPNKDGVKDSQDSNKMTSNNPLKNFLGKFKFNSKNSNATPTPETEKPTPEIPINEPGTSSLMAPPMQINSSSIQDDKSDENDSIFDIISRAYKKNAYPIFLSE